MKRQKRPLDPLILQLQETMAKGVSFADISAQIFMERSTLPSLVNRKTEMTPHHRNVIQAYLDHRAQETHPLAETEETAIVCAANPLLSQDKKRPPMPPEMQDAIRKMLQEGRSPVEIASELRQPYHSVIYIKRKMGLVRRIDYASQLRQRLEEYVFGCAYVISDAEINAECQKSPPESLQALLKTSQALTATARALEKHITSIANKITESRHANPQGPSHCKPNRQEPSPAQDHTDSPNRCVL